MPVSDASYGYFMKKALALAETALAAGEFPVGCVMVHQDRIVATGTRKGTVADARNEIDHAEMVALRDLAESRQALDHREITIFCTMEPCLMCYAALILAGVGTIVFAYEDVMGGGTGCDLSRLKPLYKNSTIEVVPHLMRKESLKIFQTYFSSSANRYWRGSLLAEYTLAQ
jgi:tRNA(adenine34) deaminase